MLFVLAMEHVLDRTELPIAEHENLTCEELLEHHNFFAGAPASNVFSFDLSRHAALSFPDIAELDALLGNLDKAKGELNEPLWQIHDRFYEIDRQIEDRLGCALKSYTDLTENPLVRQRTHNFTESMSRLLTLIRTTMFCRRKIQSMQTVYVPDFARIEQHSTAVLLSALVQWVSFVACHPTLTRKKWEGLQTAVFKNEPKFFDDMLRIDAKIIVQIYDDAAKFIDEELPEVERLLREQIEMSGSLVVNDLRKVQQIGAFTALFATEIPSKIQTESDEQMSWQMETVQKTKAFGLLLKQGVMFVFESQSMQSLLLCVQISMLESIRISSKSFTFEYKEQSIKFVTSANQIKEWKTHLAEYCE